MSPGSSSSGGNSGIANNSRGDTISIVWFRRDLRVEDNPALAAGVRAGYVVTVFIWAPEEEGHYYPGRVSRWWLSQSLRHLDSSLRSLGVVSSPSGPSTLQQPLWIS
ncbi:hypothetical protein HPP92_027683 [Vanilla planifolia]|uniref:Photolyase/cryptochrome alpha/beta domain-containing protein n=1 Tax=Vanilla planifolia TaxID=51239 RepID=A0A835PBZ2_VANPL|nr:hypothetical protein HPP92_027683 [Vanilla planifolia]